MRKEPTIAVVFLAALAAACLGSHIGWANSSDDPQPDPGRPAKGWHTPLVIGAADFRPDGNEPEGFFFHPTGHIRGNGVETRFFAPVYLPDGAVVHRLTANVYDNTNSCSASDIKVYLRRNRLSSGYWYPMGYVSTSGASGWPQEIADTSIMNSEINNSEFFYFAFVAMCSGAHELMSVNVYYSE